VIRRSAAIKAEVVSEDERETTGRRTLLNYGHTIGHAIEAVSGYERFRHGEADAIGMTAAAAISRRMGLLSADDEARQRALLERFGLPTSAEGVDRAAVLAATKLDKKVRGGAVRWVLLDRLGHAVLRDDVPQSAVDEALADVLA
jgi:3-dehydroquinate synthetase